MCKGRVFRILPTGPRLYYILLLGFACLSGCQIGDFGCSPSGVAGCLPSGRIAQDDCDALAIWGTRLEEEYPPLTSATGRSLRSTWSGAALLFRRDYMEESFGIGLAAMTQSQRRAFGEAMHLCFAKPGSMRLSANTPQGDIDHPYPQWSRLALDYAEPLRHGKVDRGGALARIVAADQQPVEFVAATTLQLAQLHGEPAAQLTAIDRIVVQQRHVDWFLWPSEVAALNQAMAGPRRAAYDALVDEGLQRLTLITGLDDPALPAAYKRLRQLKFEATHRYEDIDRALAAQLGPLVMQRSASPDHSLGFHFGRYWCASDRASRWRGWRKPSGLEVAGYGLGRGTRRPAAQGGSLAARAASSARLSW